MHEIYNQTSIRNNSATSVMNPHADDDESIPLPNAWLVANKSNNNHGAEKSTKSPPNFAIVIKSPLVHQQNNINNDDDIAPLDEPNKIDDGNFHTQIDSTTCCNSSNPSQRPTNLNTLVDDQRDGNSTNTCHNHNYNYPAIDINANTNINLNVDDDIDDISIRTLSTTIENCATSDSLDRHGSLKSERHARKSRLIIRKFQKLSSEVLSSAPAPDVKIGQRISYKEYYGNEFGTIRWIGRVPQICPDWTVGVEFDNAIGEGDGSLNGRRYFIAKDCFAKFLPLSSVVLVDQHIGRPEPGTMISVMSAAVRPGQMISIQRVSTVHVQHCFLNAPHRIPGAEFLAVNTRLHCQCPNCGPCAHVIKPPRTQRLTRPGKNATHMCQFSTYTCCGMESSEETLCTYTGNKISSLPPPINNSSFGLPPIGNSWIEGSGYLSNLQAQQSKLLPEEYRYGAAPEDISSSRRKTNRSPPLRRGSGKHSRREHPHFNENGKTTVDVNYEGAILPNLDLCNQNNCLSSEDPQRQQQHAGEWQDQNLYALALPDKTKEDMNANDLSSRVGSKVIHRDSIENRYLFPTDEPIDSTLEADLENLSQARYGRNSDSRSRGSRNILRSLRSLVTCTKANSEISIPSSQLDRSRSNDWNKERQVVTVVGANEYSVECGANGSKNNEIPVRDCVSPQHNFKNWDMAHPSARHISTSSDCGFSSASQLSINLKSQNFQSPTKSLDGDVINRIYENIISRLMRNTTISSSDLDKLQEILTSHESSKCCAHQCSSPSKPSIMSNEEKEKVLTDVIYRSILQGGGELQDKTSKEAHFCLSCTGPAQDQLECITLLDRYKKMIDGVGACKKSSNALNASDSSPKSLLNSPSILDSMTLGSEASFSGTALICDSQDDIKVENKRSAATKQMEETTTNPIQVNIPKGFELKLTLSINSDKKSAAETVDDQPIERSGSDGASFVERTSEQIANSSVDLQVIPINETDMTKKFE